MIRKRNNLLILFHETICELDVFLFTIFNKDE